ncbi:caspase family protein [Asticcacaulis taihuensis]|uniref:caspase family protein n=1 Tax=Asticcacaulis taihuensis TaxID=260084 RepID=UPI0026ED7AE3|nr:caspase family protein [Asticcacaulis taihuensis]
MRKALVIGIDDYPTAPLAGCVNDAIQFASLIETNGDGSPNFSVRCLTTAEGTVTTALMHDAVNELFSGEADTALFFFAGHGLINQQTNAGFIVSQDGKKGAWGLSLTDILTLANKAHPKIKSTIIILDSCHSGFAGEVSGLGDQGQISVIGNGVTILTACHREGVAQEKSGHGIFTDLLMDGLKGSAADICGRITPASVYSHVDQTLGAWDQRPIYKANVQNFVVLRQIPPKISLDILRKLPEYFPDPTTVFALDPSYEPERGEEVEKLKHIPIVDDNVRKYKDLQACNRHGLVAPVDQPHMWHAAVFSTGCKLTALGAHYRKLAEMKRI